MQRFLTVKNFLRHYNRLGGQIPSLKPPSHKLMDITPKEQAEIMYNGLSQFHPIKTKESLEKKDVKWMFDALSLVYKEDVAQEILNFNKQK